MPTIVTRAGKGSALTHTEMDANFTNLNNAALPSGVIVLWSGSTSSIPSGWVICDGTNSTPDLRDRFVVGAGSSYSVGNTGGASSVTLTTAQMPSHSHSDVYYKANYGGSGLRPAQGGRGYQATTISPSSVGGGQSHENRPPYYALAYIMKT